VLGFLASFLPAARDLSLFQNSRPALGFTNTHIQFLPAVFSSGIQRMRGKADRLFLSDGEDDKDE
jgi:hypothetical protein